jgi:fumarate reductase subunit D
MYVAQTKGQDLIPVEIIGYTSSELASGLQLMEDSINYGDRAKVTLCSGALPDESQLQDMYLAVLASGHHISHPTARMINGVPTTEFVIRKGSPQWQLIVPLIIPILGIGLITFGILKIESITKAVVTISLVFIGGLIILAAVLQKPAMKYLERGGRIPLLSSTSKKALAVR